VESSLLDAVTKYILKEKYRQQKSALFRKKREEARLSMLASFLHQQKLAKNKNR
jgi:hypothetical protein